MVTDQYIENNQINLIDTFIDRGKSAKTFDRPDFIKLQEFIGLYHKKVDYLLVDQMDRFSRDAGEAMSMVKNLQSRYGIQIISVTEGIEFDYNTPGSFFRAGLQLLLAEEDNINRSLKIRAGLYSKKTKEGKFVFRITPFGYSKIGEPRDRRLIIHEEQAKIVRYMYDAYLKNTPMYIIKEKAREMVMTGKAMWSSKISWQIPFTQDFSMQNLLRNTLKGFSLPYMNRSLIWSPGKWSRANSKNRPDTGPSSMTPFP